MIYLKAYVQAQSNMVYSLFLKCYLLIKKNVKLHIIIKLGHQCHISKFASWYLEQATDTQLMSLVLF